MGSSHCEHCTGHCCKYLALPLESPETARDYDDMRWYLMHQGVTIFVEDGEWYIQVSTTCTHLQPDNLCGIYSTRPQICRDYKSGECDYSDGSYGYDHLFTHVDQLEAYAKEHLRKRRKPKRKTKNPGTTRNGRGRQVSVRRAG